MDTAPMALPYFKVHPPDYLNDYAFSNLTCGEFGAVMRVFLMMWQANMQLQDDDLYIARHINIPPAVWAETKTKLLNYGILIQDSGTLINSALKTKYCAAEKFSEQQRQKRKNKRKVKEL